MSPDVFRHFRPQDYRTMPWKNGGGTTTELIIEPVGASLEAGFRWRLSMAEVGVSGPFSLFPGCDRTLLLLAGHGLRLDFDRGEPLRLEQTLQPVRFSGDLGAAGTLLDGPCRDFNVITTRALCTHRLEVLVLGTQARPLPPGRVLFIFCVAGTMQVGHFRLSAQELLRIEESSGSLEAWSPDSATAIVVGIAPAGQEWC